MQVLFLLVCEVPLLLFTYWMSAAAETVGRGLAGRGFERIDAFVCRRARSFPLGGTQSGVLLAGCSSPVVGTEPSYLRA